MHVYYLYHNELKFKMQKNGRNKPNKSSAIPALLWAPTVLGHSAILGDSIHRLQKESFYWLAHQAGKTMTHAWGSWLLLWHCNPIKTCSRDFRLHDPSERGVQETSKAGNVYLELCSASLFDSFNWASERQQFPGKRRGFSACISWVVCRCVQQ